MKKLLALLFVALSSVTIHAQSVWIEENIDPDTGLRTGVIAVNGRTYPIAPGADLTAANLRFADLRGADLSGANLIGASLNDTNLVEADLSGANLIGAVFTNRLEDIYLGTLLSAVSKGNYDEIQALKPQVETNTTESTNSRPC